VRFHICRILAELLIDAELRDLRHEEKLAFWINVYNALLMHVSPSSLFLGYLMKKVSTFVQSKLCRERGLLAVEAAD
jgi:hypothetical protein